MKFKFWNSGLGDRLVRKADVDVSIGTGIVASTTQTLAGATALTKDVNVIATVANADDAVKLPEMEVGDSCEVYNDGANAASVFPSAATIAIDGGSAGAAVTLTNAKRAKFTQISATVIKSAQLGAVSA